MDQFELEMMTLSGKGYCCSQIMVILALQAMGEDNPELVRAMSGLCNGGGSSQGPCGVLTGAYCLLGLYAGKGQDHEDQDELLPLMLTELEQWFKSAMQEQFSGWDCSSISGDLPPSPSTCGQVATQTFSKAVEILNENGFDLTEGKG